MRPIFVSGLGAVSPAGWNLASMRDALAKQTPLPFQPLSRPGWPKPLRARVVPVPSVRPALLSHPRLRRSSPITHYAASAALEALSHAPVADRSEIPIGLVLCLQSGCVQYSQRFFGEVLQDPGTASPLVFPETVLAAPASHVAALLSHVRLVSTLVGDPATFLQGVALATQWLADGQVTACLVIGADETNWLLADALWHFEHAAVLGGGAGALCLSAEPSWSMGVELEAITDVHSYTRANGRGQAARAMRAQLRASCASDLLCDGTSGSPRADSPELAAWSDWTGARLSPKRILGEGLMAASAWQCVAGCDAILNGPYTATNVSLVGCNQQAIGARFVRTAK
jgi:3-oxoacyl-(acyl-carrier-protein) synthase